MTKSFAVVVLNWNGLSLLQQFLPDLVANSPQAQVYVADNASTDGSVAWVQKACPQVVCVELPTNLGYAGGYNAALQGIQEPYWVLVNSDIQVTPHWLVPIDDFFQHHPECGLIQPKIRAYRQPTQFEYAGACGGFIDRFGFPYCRGRLFDTLEADTGQYDEPMPVFWASGACLAVRKQVFVSLGGFDAHFFAHQEEIDLCWRAFNQGIQAWVLPQSVVYHVGGATLAEGSPHKTYLNFRNSLWMLCKNLPTTACFWIIPTRMVLDGLAGLRFALQGKGQLTWAIVRAHGAFYRALPRLIAARKGPFRPSYYQHPNVVWAYFVGKIKKWSQLKR